MIPIHTGLPLPLFIVCLSIDLSRFFFSHQVFHPPGLDFMYSVPSFYILTTQDRAIHRTIMDSGCLFDQEGVALRMRWHNMGQLFSADKIPLTDIRGDPTLVVARSG